MAGNIRSQLDRGDVAVENSKKVGLVTYCAGNIGSALQCFATQQYLSKKEVDCFLITRLRERGPARVMQSLEYRAGAWLKLLKFPSAWPAYKKCRNPEASNHAMTPESAEAIRDFIDRHIQVKEYTWNQLIRVARSHEYMAFFSGSDQIWNGLWFFTTRFWFLRFCPKEKRVAWAPSFGADSVAVYNQSLFQRYLSEYQFLSAREPSGRETIRELTGRSAPLLPDPTYLLTAEEWRQIEVPMGLPAKYILMFFISEPERSAIDCAENWSRQQDADVIWLSYRHCDTRDFANGGPSEFLSCIDHADLVLTDSFHASLFSVILSTPFFVFPRTDENGRTQLGRIQNLLEKFQMADRLVAGSVPRLSAGPDEAQIRAVLAKERERSDAFLSEVINFYSGE